MVVCKMIVCRMVVCRKVVWMKVGERIEEGWRNDGGRLEQGC
jgi:hypothetical protein